MTYRITAEEENEIDSAFNDRDAARANARRLKTALDKAVAENAKLRAALEIYASGCGDGRYARAALANEQEGK